MPLPLGNTYVVITSFDIVPWFDILQADLLLRFNSIDK